LRWAKLIALLAMAGLPLAACVAPAIGQTSQPRVVRVLVPAFESSGALGNSVATVLTLRLQTTLRPYPIPNPLKLDFGRGIVNWSQNRLEEQTPAAALERGAAAESEIVVWGYAQQYGDGVVVQSYATVSPFSTSGFGSGAWIVRANGAEVRLGLPSANYQFTSLILSNEVVSHYTRPDRLQICADKGRNCYGARLTVPFRGVRVDGDWELVRGQGWVELPELSHAQGEVIDFTAGLIAYLREDLELADRYFSNVIESDAEGLVRDDATMLRGVCRARHGGSTEGLKAAQANDKYSVYAVQALIMAYIQAAAAGPASSDAERSEARRLMHAYDDLLRHDSSWFAGAARALGYIRE
jgi:hypothetical protein